MYKELKSQLARKKILEEQIRGNEEQIKFKIQKQLGLHATTFQELKIECITIDDKFARVFSQIEKLDKERENLVGELEVINNALKKINDLMAKMNEVEMNVFRCRYILGLSVRETAERLHFDERHIKRITKEILQK